MVWPTLGSRKAKEQNIRDLDPIKYVILFGLPESSTQAASRSVQPFLLGSGQTH